MSTNFQINFYFSHKKGNNDYEIIKHGCSKRQYFNDFRFSWRC